MLQRVRSAAIIGAAMLLAISWSFALIRLKTGFYPALWAAALPLLAFYYCSGPRPFGASWKHLPAAMIAVYILVLWHVAEPYQALGVPCTVAGGLGAAGAAFAGGRLRAAELAAEAPRSRKHAQRFARRAARTAAGR